ncbi:hypothetical protein V7793_04635 [Streptomyces sp. KLMMK]|uniref:hypothetical protein n=1 Tax=Streptomyces sp. KLMMK TaxID=3109353 RepID=UPI0030007E3E
MIIPYDLEERMRVRTVLAVTVFTATALFGGAGLATAAPQGCTALDDQYTLPVNKIAGERLEFVIGKEGRETFVDKLFCVDVLRMG